MTTYTVATVNGMIVATVPDGEDIAAAVAAEAKNIGSEFGEYAVETGLTLTDTLGEDEEWELKSGTEGWLIDESGKDWAYAVRRAA